MSRPPSWASFTRPINAANATPVAAKPAPPPGVYWPPQHDPGFLPPPPFHQPVAAAPYYPPANVVSSMPDLTQPMAGLVNTTADQDASIRGLLADILGGGDGSNATPIPGEEEAENRGSLKFFFPVFLLYLIPNVPSPSFFPAPQPAVVPYQPNLASLYPPSTQVPPFSSAGYPPQFPPQVPQMAQQAPVSQPLIVPQQKGRQLISLTGPHVANNNNHVNGSSQSINGHGPQPLMQLPPHQRQTSPLNGVSNGEAQVNGQVLRPGMKRKPSDDSAAAASSLTSATSAAHAAPPPSDEEYKKSTKHFLYHCDVCNFTCQGPGIYYHIVSPKHKNSCQKLGRAYIEPKGVLVGSRGPKKDRSTGHDYQTVGENQHSGADPIEEDEVSSEK